MDVGGCKLKRENLEVFNVNSVRDCILSPASCRFSKCHNTVSECSFRQQPYGHAVTSSFCVIFLRLSLYLLCILFAKSYVCYSRSMNRLQLSIMMLSLRLIQNCKFLIITRVIMTSCFLRGEGALRAPSTIRLPYLGKND